MNDKFKRYISNLDKSSISSISGGVIELIDAFMDGNSDFFLSTAEEYKQYLGNMNGIKLNSIYDDFTKKAIYRFIYEFQKLFPNILSTKEIVNRINNNLLSNIEFEDLTKEEFKIERSIIDNRLPDEVISGYYNPIAKKLYIDKNISSYNTDSVLFHEFLHVLSIDRYRKGEDQESEFLSETLVALMQEKFERRRYNNYYDRTTTYLTNYMKQLEVIYGKELFTTYFNNYRDLSKLFNIYPVRENIGGKEVLHKMIELFNVINYGVKTNDNPYKIEFANTTFELNLAFLLSSYFNYHRELTDDEKIEKIRQMISLQKSPNFDVYKKMIDKYVKDKGRIKYFPEVNFVVNNDRDNYNNNELLKDKYIRFLSAKRFGFTDIEDYKNNPLFDTKNNIFYSYGKDYYRYLHKQNYYNLITRLHYDADINLYGSKIEEVYEENSSASESLSRELRDGYDVSKRALFNYKIDDFSSHIFLFKATKENNSIYVENNIVPSIYTKRVLEDVVKGLDSKIKDIPYNKLLIDLYEGGMSEVYLARNKKDIICESNGLCYVYHYKNFSKRYDIKCFRLKRKNIENIDSLRLKKVLK